MPIELGESQMKRFIFEVTLSGIGDTPEKAWNDACEQFGMDNGPCPECYAVEEDEDET